MQFRAAGRRRHGHIYLDYRWPLRRLDRLADPLGDVVNLRHAALLRLDRALPHGLGYRAAFLNPGCVEKLLAPLLHVVQQGLHDAQELKVGRGRARNLLAHLGCFGQVALQVGNPRPVGQQGLVAGRLFELFVVNSRIITWWVE